MLTPDEIASDEEARAYLRRVAAMAGDFYSALRDSGVPDAAAEAIVVAWHDDLLGDGIVWESDED